MKFGRASDLSNLDLTLPADHPLTSAVLSGRKKRGCEIYVGCPVWAEPKMVGIVYPKGTKPADYLKAYATQFNAIELNATGYGTPSEVEVGAWVKSVGKALKFCPKIPRQISHTNPIAKNSRELSDFLDRLPHFRKNLGPTLLQLSPHFSPDRISQLWDFCDKWDPTFPLQIELRHEGWFADPTAFASLVQQLRKRKVGLAITDVTDRRDVLHQCLTTRTAFIRFDGHDLHPSDFNRLDDWAQRSAAWIELGLESFYFFVHTPQKHLNPYLTDYFIERLNALAKVGIKRPTLLKPHQP